MGRPTKESQVVQFEWAVPVAGYRWVERDEVESVDGAKPHEFEKIFGDDWLVIREILDTTKIEFRRLATLRDSPALFRTLAELKPAREEIREFSSQHGFLLGPQPSDTARNNKRFVLRSGNEGSDGGLDHFGCG